MKTILAVLFSAWTLTVLADGKPLEVTRGKDEKSAGPKLTSTPVVLGDYDAEPRTGGHVDTDRLVRRLGDLGANTYPCGWSGTTPTIGRI